MRCTLNKYFDRGIETKSAPIRSHIIFNYRCMYNIQKKNKITKNDTHKKEGKKI